MCKGVTLELRRPVLTLGKINTHLFKIDSIHPDDKHYMHGYNSGPIALRMAEEKETRTGANYSKKYWQILSALVKTVKSYEHE